MFSIMMRMEGSVNFYLYHLNFTHLKCLAAGLEVVSFRKKDIHNV